MWLIVIAVVQVALTLYASWSWTKSDNSSPRLAGDGGYAIEVAGGTNYLASFEKTCGKRTTDCINR